MTFTCPVAALTVGGDMSATCPVTTLSIGADMVAGEGNPKTHARENESCGKEKLQVHG
jgi:hypothetical protein